MPWKPGRFYLINCYNLINQSVNTEFAFLLKKDSMVRAFFVSFVKYLQNTSISERLVLRSLRGVHSCK